MDADGGLTATTVGPPRVATTTSAATKSVASPIAGTAAQRIVRRREAGRDNGGTGAVLSARTSWAA